MQYICFSISCMNVLLDYKGPEITRIERIGVSLKVLKTHGFYSALNNTHGFAVSMQVPNRHNMNDSPSCAGPETLQIERESCARAFAASTVVFRGFETVRYMCQILTSQASFRSNIRLCVLCLMSGFSLIVHFIGKFCV